jgi:hypothetical protein
LILDRMTTGRMPIDKMTQQNASEKNDTRQSIS